MRFLPFATAVGAFASITLMCLASATGHECQKTANKRLSSAGSAIREIITSALREVNNTLVYVGNQIVQEDSFDLQKVARHMKMIEKGRYYQDATIYSYTCLDWVNPDNYMVANGLEGIVRTPVHIKHRIYTAICPFNPWRLILCKPAYGYSSGTWIIPFGMGVFDHKGEFWGILTGGINIATVSQKIRQTVLDPLADFIISDGDCNIICSSFSEDEKALSSTVRELFAACDGNSQERRILDPPFQTGTTHFYGYQKMETQPIYLFMGINKRTLQSDFFALFLPHVIGVVCFSLFSLVAFYFFLKKSTRSIKQMAESIPPVLEGNALLLAKQPTPELEELRNQLERVGSLVQNLQEEHKKNGDLEEENRSCKQNLQMLEESTAAREDVLAKIQQEQLLVVEDISSLVTVLLKNWTGRLDLSLSSTQHVQFLQSIFDSVQQLQTATTNTLTPIEIHPGEVLKECLKIQFSTAFSKRVKLSFSVPKEIPLCLGNELRLKQILLSLLFKAIHATPQDGEVKAELALVSKEGKVCLQFKIRDNGFGLTEEDLSRFSKEGQRPSPFSLELSAIEQLVQLQGGYLQVETKWQQGNVFTVILPYESPVLQKKDFSPTFTLGAVL